MERVSTEGKNENIKTQILSMNTENLKGVNQTKRKSEAKEY